jgi:sodium transport system ATP-binding protein
MARVAGYDVRTDPIGVRRSLGYVSATTGVPDRLSPREVLDSFGRLHGIDRRLLADRIASLTASLDLGGFLDRPCGRLSSGQRQRVSLARALVHDPPALVLDEPTSTLDVVGARDLFAMLQSLRAEGRTILVSTHRLHEIEHRCDRFVIIDAGRIVAAGSRAELVADRSGGLEEAFFATIGGGAA